MISSKYEENYDLKTNTSCILEIVHVGCFLFVLSFLLLGLCKKRLKKAQYLHKYSENFKNKNSIMVFCSSMALQRTEMFHIESSRFSFCLICAKSVLIIST